MTTWTQLQDLARQKFRLRRDEPSELVLEVPLPGGTVELVHGQTVREFEQEWLLLRVAVCNEKMLDIPAALQRSAQQVMGALVLADHLLALRHGMPLATLRADDFEQAALFLARTAAYMRERLRASSGPAGPEAAPPPEKPATALFGSWGD